MSEGGAEKRGAISTRREVVDFILDLIGYTADRPLYEKKLLEPSFGNGDFLLAAIERLIAAYQYGRKQKPLEVASLMSCICSVELHRDTFIATGNRIDALLDTSGFKKNDRRALLDAWLTHGDFLLTSLPGDFDYVAGNPPYIRQELIPDALMAEYRRRFRTIYDRADIYVPFIEKSLSLLRERGTLGFICADRWMKNRYGGPLRRLVAEKYHLKFFIDMVDTPAFHSDVIAYPAITIIANEPPGPTRLAHRPEINEKALSSLAETMLNGSGTLNGTVEVIEQVSAGKEPWILESFDRLAVVRRLEREFPTLKEAGCKVGIGVATGADQVFIAPFDALDVESDRKLPLVMTRDILSGAVQWRGFGVINPFNDEGGLVALDKYPRLYAYLKEHDEKIKKRHVSQKNPNNWYRTIDRIYPALARRPKLLIPDIKGEAHVVYEDGHFYPHHNLYFITSDEWDLRALQAVLLSGIAKLFVAIYSTKMRGGYLRFQAQHLRRIRVPLWQNVPGDLKFDLAAAAGSGDIASCNEATFRLYRMSKAERTILAGNGS
ncbi:MAG: modification methylase PaeR7I [Rhodospirillales bacterium RIFCSPLOWO2_12_FULL_58_28]|nr:MAG: modification methylase PaeR7I [Rhodospirillales bacterium RIFCSPLOWO2_02_FULL_58_16]OHC79102.1 MAG: modification methylase PaeR7I [Rhodospirillales bacterium RIFCSPLOWO2_12_FULL_58_28]